MTWPRQATRLLFVLLVIVPLGATPASAAPAAAPAFTLTISGHGWGHGRGMGQWGAFGYVQDYGWSAAQILDHYYGGSIAASLGSNPPIKVRLTALDGQPLIVTSGRPFAVSGVPIAGGSVGWLSRDAAGVWILTTSYGCGQPWVWSTPVADPTFTSSVADPGNDLSAMLALCEAGGSRAYRGSLTATFDGRQHAVNTLGLEDYVRAVIPREMPSTWPVEALKVQAVAARSYGWARTRGVNEICDSTACQVYNGAGKGTTRFEAASTDQATAATAGIVRVRATDGAPLATEFSSSTGGYTAGGTFLAVPDAGDAIAANPHHNWTAQINSQAVADRYGVGDLLDLVVTARTGIGDAGGRVVSVFVQGTTKSIAVSGGTFRNDFGLRSDWFVIRGMQPRVLLRNSATTGVANLTVGYGVSGDVPLMCDFNGDGTDSPVVFRNGFWFVRDSNTSGVADRTFVYGGPGDVPICGHWNGGAVDGPGVFRRGAFYLRLSPTTGVHDVLAGFGNPTDVPLVGDWNADGVDTFGVFRGGFWFLKQTNGGSGSADVVVAFGNSGDMPAPGDWNGDGLDSPGVFRRGTWFLRASVSTGIADAGAFGYGTFDDRPLTGDFDGNHVDSIGVARHY